MFCSSRCTARTSSGPFLDLEHVVYIRPLCFCVAALWSIFNVTLSTQKTLSRSEKTPTGSHWGQPASGKKNAAEKKKKHLNPDPTCHLLKFSQMEKRDHETINRCVCHFYKKFSVGCGQGARSGRSALKRSSLGWHVLSVRWNEKSSQVNCGGSVWASAWKNRCVCVCVRIRTHILPRAHLRCDALLWLLH